MRIVEFLERVLWFAAMVGFGRATAPADRSVSWLAFAVTVALATTFTVIHLIGVRRIIRANREIIRASRETPRP